MAQGRSGSECEEVEAVEEVQGSLGAASRDSEGNFRDILPERLPGGKGGNGMKVLAFSSWLVKRVASLVCF